MWQASVFGSPSVPLEPVKSRFARATAHFYRQLRQLVDAGFGKRIMFGSDQMIWPDAIAIAIETIEQAPFLSAQQRRDILYNNAARFLRLSEAEMARHRGAK